MSARILIMAGGTGGHVFPALSLAAALRNHGCELTWLGTRSGIESRLVPAAGIAIEYLDIGGLRGKGWSSWLRAPWRLLRSLWAAYRLIWRLRPGVVVGLGGYATGPGGLAAWLCRRPLLIHEQNAVAGMTNRLLARFASGVYEAFPHSFPPGVKTHVIGNPVRAEFFELPAPTLRYAARENAIQILVIGGSQGAAKLNSIVPDALARVDEQVSLRVRHQSGTRELESTRAHYAKLGLSAEVIPFIDDVVQAYSEADILICRAGALTVSEVAAAGIAAIFVPLAVAVDDHQTRNAQMLERVGAALILPESALNAEHLAHLMTPLTANRAALAQMGLRARQCANPHATESLMKACLQAAGVRV
jgi:UDP-N-acetylglucosamine--N-acetylmuramyl-(pentapeptide) pyrophosphoryl-undecaprenol N-acetylglucosamine transferase